jgi:hypothetical protein
MPSEALSGHVGRAGDGVGSYRLVPAVRTSAQSSQSTLLSPRSSSTRIRSARRQRPQLTLMKSSLATAAFSRVTSSGRERLSL